MTLAGIARRPLLARFNGFPLFCRSNLSDAGITSDQEGSA
jgi:hypothetical protein